MRVASVVAAFCSTALVGCTGALPTAAPLLVGGYSSGGPAPLITTFTITRSGRVSLAAPDGAAHRSSLGDDELSAINVLLESPEWLGGLAEVRGKGADWACCDRELIFIGFGDARPLEIPVHDSVVGVAPSGGRYLSEQYAVPAALHPGLQLIHRIMVRHFPNVWRGPGFGRPSA
jgi:hypothetical protein